MTTVATDGKTIAADGLATYGDIIVETQQRKIVQRDGVLFATTGGSAAGDAAIAWYLGGADPQEAPKGKWTLIVVLGVDQPLFVFNDEEPYADEWSVPAAFGSGHAIARAAMICGKSPAEAVAVAATLDPMTGGEITVVDIGLAIGDGMARAAE